MVSDFKREWFAAIMFICGERLLSEDGLKFSIVERINAEVGLNTGAPY